MSCVIHTRGGAGGWHQVVARWHAPHGDPFRPAGRPASCHFPLLRATPRRGPSGGRCRSWEWEALEAGRRSAGGRQEGGTRWQRGGTHPMAVPTPGFRSRCLWISRSVLSNVSLSCNPHLPLLRKLKARGGVIQFLLLLARRNKTMESKAEQRGYIPRRSIRL